MAIVKAMQTAERRTRYITIREMAVFWDCSQGTIMRALSSGLIPSERTATGRRRVRRDAFMADLELRRGQILVTEA